jgi:hypothetical protein
VVQTYRWRWRKSVGLGFLLANDLAIPLDILVAWATYRTVTGSGVGLLTLTPWVGSSVWLHRQRTRPVTIPVEPST